MRLSGITLQTEYFEDYLSFLTEVLELEVSELTDISMRLDLTNTWLEIKMVPTGQHQVATNVQFSLGREAFEALVHKLSFFYYRKGPTRFLFLGATDASCEIIDPDGRVWRFLNEITASTSPAAAAHL